MAVGKLLGAIIDGVGLSAGRDLYGRAKRAIEAEEPPPPTAEELAAQRKADERAREQARKAAEKAAREKQAADARTAREIESELAALKKRVAKK